MKSSSTLIHQLLRLGCEYFVCAGRNAEELHDFIDQLIESRDEQSTHIATTYHNDEPADLLVNFFVNATNMPNQSCSGLVAILSETSPGDRIIRKLLLKS